MVQEYKDAQSLAVPRQWTPQEVKQIAISVLEILVYLQNRIPAVIHRDIKPENILIDEQMNVYLVDFGFARIGSAEGAMSSVATGTFGFMAPEQIYNRELSNATDLYGLGATLICLLTGTKSTAVETLMDDLGRFNFKRKLSKLNQGFVNWLEKMVQPKQKDRYASAAMAKEALIPLNFNLVPEVKFSQSSLKFKANQLGEKVTQIITVTNPIPKTVLEGSWDVAPHPSDPPHTPSAHEWISFSSASFKGNQVECSISVDTSNLIADQVYNREILLQTNSEPKTHNLKIEVQTGSLASLKNSYPYPALMIAGLLLYIFCPSVIGLIGYSIFFDVYSIFLLLVNGKLQEVILKFLVFIIIIIGSLFGFIFGYRIGLKNGFRFLSLVIPCFIFYQMFMQLGLGMTGGYAGLSILRYMGFVLIGNIFGFLVKKHTEAGFSQKSAIQISILVSVLSSTSLIQSILGLQNPSIKLAFMIFGVIGINQLRTMEIQQSKKLIDEYRQSEPGRIKP